MAQVTLCPAVPAVNVLDHPQPARIVQRAAEFAEPRTQAIGDSVQDPNANLGVALHAVLPALRFFDADAEQADDGFATHGGAKFLAVFSIGPRRHDAAPGLAVGYQHGSQFANGFHVQRTQRAAAGVRDDAGIGIDLAHRAVPNPPEIEEPLLPPEEVGAAGRVLEIAGSRQIEAGGFLEILAAMFAITLAGPVPAIDKNAVHTVARHDLLLDCGHELKIVRTQRARHPHLRRRPMAARPALRVHGDPIWVRGLNVIIGGVRVGAHEDDQAQFAAAGNQFAQHVAVAQPGAAMVKWNLRRIIRHATAAAEANGVGVGAPEIIQPEGGVELAGVVLHQGELRPAHRFVHPGRSGRARRRLWRTSRQTRRERRESGKGARRSGCFQELSAGARRCRHAGGGLDCCELLCAAAEAVSRLFSREIQQQHEIGNVRPGRASEDQIAGFFKKGLRIQTDQMRLNIQTEPGGFCGGFAVGAGGIPIVVAIRAEGNENLIVPDELHGLQCQELVSAAVAAAQLLLATQNGCAPNQSSAAEPMPKIPDGP